MGQASTKESRTNPSGSSAGSSRHAAPRERTSSRRRDKRKDTDQMIKDPSETVDGGYLFPQGVYNGPQDFKLSVVRDLIIRRRMAPFYKGQEIINLNWTDDQLLAVIKSGNPDAATASTHSAEQGSRNMRSSDSGSSLWAPSDRRRLADGISAMNLSSPSSPASRRNSSKTLIQPHAAIPGSVSKTSGSLRTTSPANSAGNVKSEFDKQQLWLYRNTRECPICFLLYPRLNAARCCGQEICTECFVQIKRPAPHSPHNNDDSSDMNSRASTSVSDASCDASRDPDVPELVSEPANCPFCTQPNFGIVFEAPPFEWGIPKPPDEPSFAGKGGGREALAENHPQVVTTDMIRPDWEAKLMSARRHLARKSAAARALHRNALLPLPGASNGPTPNSNARPSRRSDSHWHEFLRAYRGMSSAETRALEKRMMEEAIRASLREQ